MKLVSYRHHGRAGVGHFDEISQRIVPLDDQEGHPIHHMLDLIEGGLEQALPSVLHEPLALIDIQLLAPIPRPARNIFCVGHNYPRPDRSHGGQDDEGGPIIFTKAPQTVIGDGDIIEYPRGISEAVDYEAELAVVIGRRGRAIPREQALAHVFGYTIINDVTARDSQRRHQQWFLGKSFDTFCPMGPCIVTADALDASALELSCHVNGELRQQANTRDLIFDIASLIASISAGMTLYPGDVIATGTPSGFGAGFDPPRFLRSGDEVRIAIDGIGELTNSVF